MGLDDLTTDEIIEVTDVTIVSKRQIP